MCSCTICPRAVLIDHARGGILKKRMVMRKQLSNAEVREPAPHVVGESKARLRIDGVRRGQASIR